MERLLYTLVVVLLIGSGAVLADLPSGQNTADREGSLQATPRLDWVRTAHGWEQSSRWQHLLEDYTLTPALRIHPLLIALLELLISLAALVAFPPYLPITRRATS